MKSGLLENLLIPVTKNCSILSTSNLEICSELIGNITRTTKMAAYIDDNDGICGI